MNDPWEILGLDPQTATEADVKRAYAKLLRQHRPDKDPEGFRRIHDARDIAIDQIQWVRPDIESSNLDIEIEDPPPDPAAAENTVFKPQAPSKSPLEQAIDDCDWDRVEAELDRLADVPAAQWARNLSLVWEGGAPEIAEQRIDRAKLFGAVAAEELNLARRWIEMQEFREEFEELERFAQQLLAGRAQLDDPTVGPLFVEMGRIIGMVFPKTARDLLNDAFGTIQSGWALDQAERNVAIGHQLERLPINLRKSWAKHLSENDENTTITGSKAQQLVAHTQLEAGAGWPGFQLLRTTGPKVLRQATTSASQRAQFAERAAAEPEPEGCGSGLRTLGIIFFALVMAIWIGSKFVNQISFDSEDEAIPPPDTAFWQEYLEKIEKSGGNRAPWTKSTQLRYEQMQLLGCEAVEALVEDLPDVERERTTRLLLLMYARDSSTSASELGNLEKVGRKVLSREDFELLRAMIGAAKAEPSIQTAP